MFLHCTLIPVIVKANNFPMASRKRAKVEQYGLWWDDFTPQIQREIFCIQHGGRWSGPNGQQAGAGLFHHYKRLQEILWPEDDHHRWSDLILEEILNNTITAILGPKDSGKTHCALAKFGLTDYFCFPDTTLILISSTDIRGLEYRVWGDLKNLFERAREQFPFLSGHLIDSKHAICTQNLDFSQVRDMRKGIACIPCMSSAGGWIGLGKYVGIKQKRRRLLADECQMMRPAFMEAIANLNSGDFKGVFVGNPLGGGDPLDKISEPKGGWGTEGEIAKTTTWSNKFLEGRTINLVGTDSPNFDFPKDQPPRYDYLIHQNSIDRVSEFYGKDSLQYFSQCLGIRKPGLNARRVITRALCVKFGAMREVIWLNRTRTLVYAIDAAYGSIGGDRCVGGWIEFGQDVNDKQMLLVHAPVIIPVSAKEEGGLPEDQIAQYVKQDCERLGISADHVFYDATGRGSLGTSFGRAWSAYVNPVEFGGRPTERPVTADHYFTDPVTKERRLKRCDEHYSKFVTELWFSVRYATESSQLRGLPEDVMDEGAMREWKMVKGDKIEIETKAEMKERMGRSPDLFDWLATALEGARRLGFQIQRISRQDVDFHDDKWKDDLRERADKVRKSFELQPV